MKLSTRRCGNGQQNWYDRLFQFDIDASGNVEVLKIIKLSAKCSKRTYDDYQLHCFILSNLEEKIPVHVFFGLALKQNEL